MKKIYSFMVAAVAMIAAAACTQELENVEPEVNGESVVFTAYADGADETKTALSGTKSLWQSGDRIWILNGEGDWKKGYSTTDNSATATFTEEDNSYALEGEQYFAVYPAAAAGDATWEGGDVLGVTLKSVQDATAGSYDPAAHIAVAQSNTTSLNFKNAVSLLKFTVRNEGVKSVTIYARGGGLLTGSCNISAEGNVTPWTGDGEANGWVELSAGEGTFAVGTEYYIAVFPNTDEANLTAGFTVQFSFGGAKYDVKSYTKALTLNRNEILDLGELEYTAAERTETVYLCPGVWNADEAWFAAYFFGTAGEATAVTMNENDGVYSCEVPGDYENVIFCRMSNEYNVFGWDVWEGETETENHVWNKSADLNVPLKDAAEVYYNVTDWEAGEWSATPQESTPEVVEKEWGIVGTMTSWTDNISMTLVDGWYVAENVTIKTSDEFKFRVGTTWDELKTYNLTTIVANTEYTTVDGQGDGNGMKVAVSAIYSVYLSADAATMKVVKTGDLPAESVPDQQSDWAVAGSFNDWGDYPMVTTNVPDLFVAKNVSLDAYANFKVKAKYVDANNDGWGTSFGQGSINNINKNVWFTVSSSGSNIINVYAGTYDIYFDAVGKKVYLMTAGTTYTSATEQTVSGESQPIVNGKTIYLNTNIWGTEANYTAWVWKDGSEGSWVKFEPTNEDGIYSTVVPSDATHMIFLRKSPTEHSLTDWNCWNRTGNESIGSNNCFTVTGWSGGNNSEDGERSKGTWSIK